jgi:hypothetical protein
MTCSGCGAQLPPETTSHFIRMWELCDECYEEQWTRRLSTMAEIAQLLNKEGLVNGNCPKH